MKDVRTLSLWTFLCLAPISLASAQNFEQLDYVHDDGKGFTQPTVLGGEILDDDIMTMLDEGAILGIESGIQQSVWNRTWLRSAPSLPFSCDLDPAITVSFVGDVPEYSQVRARLVFQTMTSLEIDQTAKDIYSHFVAAGYDAIDGDVDPLDLERNAAAFPYIVENPVIVSGDFGSYNSYRYNEVDLLTERQYAAWQADVVSLGVNLNLTQASRVCRRNYDETFKSCLAAVQIRPYSRTAMGGIVFGSIFDKHPSAFGLRPMHEERYLRVLERYLRIQHTRVFEVQFDVTAGSHTFLSDHFPDFNCVIDQGEIFVVNAQVFSPLEHLE